MSMSRRCLECDRPLKPEDQGALCSPCYFEIITSDPMLAAPEARAESPSDPSSHAWARQPRPPAPQ
jgi:hypothetical protein